MPNCAVCPQVTAGSATLAGAQAPFPPPLQLLGSPTLWGALTAAQRSGTGLLQQLPACGDGGLEAASQDWGLRWIPSCQQRQLGLLRGEQILSPGESSQPPSCWPNTTWQRGDLPLQGTAQPSRSIKQLHATSSCEEHTHTHTGPSWLCSMLGTAAASASASALDTEAAAGKAAAHAGENEVGVEGEREKWSSLACFLDQWLLAGACLSPSKGSAREAGLFHPAMGRRLTAPLPVLTPPAGQQEQAPPQRK